MTEKPNRDADYTRQYNLIAALPETVRSEINRIAEDAINLGNEYQIDPESLIAVLMAIPANVVISNLPHNGSSEDEDEINRRIWAATDALHVCVAATRIQNGALTEKDFKK